MSNPRVEAARIIQTILEDKVFFSEIKQQIAENERPFVNMLVLTALRHWQGLQAILRHFLAKKIPHKHRAVQYLLLLAITELLLLNTPPYAVINESVKNVRQAGDKFLGAMANAVLRKIAADKEHWQQYLQQYQQLPATFLPVLAGYSTEQIEKIATAVPQQPPLDLTVKENPPMWAEKLAAKLLPNGSLRLPNAQQVAQLEGFAEGAWWVQDAAAALAVQIMGDLHGQKVVDLCAAPGGKTAQLAAAGAEVTALDISASRLEKLAQNMQRLGFDKVQTQTGDALDFMQHTDTIFDAVLLDAPCSATGTLRRHPEVLYLKTAEDMQTQCRIQRQMLEKCARILRVGGTLVYSVCSLAKAEGEEQIKQFLTDHQNFQLQPITAEQISPYGTWSDVLITAEGWIRTLPSYLAEQNGMDGFFICKMQRII